MDIESWFDSERQILTEIRPNVDLEFVQEITRFLMSTFQSVSVRILTDFDDFWPVVTLFHNFLGFHMLLRPKYCHSDEDFTSNSPLLNFFRNKSPDKSRPNTWICMGKFRDHLLDFWRKSTFFDTDLVLSADQVDFMTFWRCRCQKVQKNLDISMYRFEKNKEINKSLSENDDTTIENTFWSTEVNFWPISANGGSLRVSNTVLVHLQWS